MRKEKSCGCVVFNKDREVLLVQMNYGHWSFPKGHVEPGETEMETALRETFEETSISCNLLSDFREVSSYSPNPNVIKDVVFFIGFTDYEDIKRQESEIKDAEFVCLEKAKQLITYNSDLVILDKVLKHLEANKL